MTTRRGEEPLGPGSCHWARPGGEYAIEGDPEQPLGFLTSHFDLLDDAAQPRAGAAPLPPERLEEVDEALMLGVFERLIALSQASDLREQVTPGHAGRLRTQFAGDKREVATRWFTALLIDLDHRNPPDEAVLASPVSTSAQADREAKMRQIILHLSEHPEHAPPVAELAQQAGYTRSHFTRLFQQMTGEPPQRFLITWRMRHACRLLAETNQQVKEIAHHLGYRDEYFFSRQFKSQLGVSPTNYRRRSTRSLGAALSSDPIIRGT